MSSQLATDTDMPPEYISECEVFRMLDSLQPTAAGRWTDYQTTSVVPPGGSAYILQNDRSSVQHVACYIHNTETVERS